MTYYHANTHFLTGIINTESDSLFTYNTGKVWSDFYLPDFEAIFLTNVVSILADEVCGDDPFCRFDIIVTGRTDIATSTLEGSTNVELVSNLSLPSMKYPNLLIEHNTECMNYQWRKNQGTPGAGTPSVQWSKHYSLIASNLVFSGLCGSSVYHINTVRMGFALEPAFERVHS